MAITHNSEVIFHINLDENKIPENISWTAKDGGIENEPSKAVMISVWDHKQKMCSTKEMNLKEIYNWAIR